MSTFQIDRRSRLRGPANGPGAAARRASGFVAAPFRNGALFARDHGKSLFVLLILLGLTGVFHAVGMFRNPQVIDDEGTYVAQAWAVVNLRELAHYTFWYDHPPLGWFQLGIYAELTGAFDRAAHAIDAGREFVFVTHLVSVVLLWVLARRLRFARWSAALTVAVFALSPLAVQFHRVVFLDNIATPWVLASFVLAASPRRRLADVAGAAVCFGVAVLTKETTLLLLPALAWLLWQSTDRSTRRYTLAVASSLFVAIGTAYLLFAVVKGELTPGADRVSLFEGLRFQLLGRDAGGSVFQPGSANRRTAELWFNLDWVTPVVAALVAPLALFVRRLRPFAVGFVLMALMLVRPGYLPVPFVIAVLPLMALLIGGMADEAWRRRPSRSSLPVLGRMERRFAPVLLIVGAAVLLVAVPLWASKHRGLLQSDPNRPVVEATAWLVDNVPGDHRLMVDDIFWVDLVEAGFDRSNVVWAYKVNSDPAVEALSPRGWRDYDYLVMTEGMRQATDPGADVALAVQNSVPVARFGQGGEMIEIRRILDPETDADRFDTEAAARLRASLSTALLVNPAVRTEVAASEALASGTVDERVLTVLAAASQHWDLTVADLPFVHGEEEVGTLRRVAIITAVDGADASDAAQSLDLQRWLNDQRAFGVAATSTREGLVISVPPMLPSRDGADPDQATRALTNQEETT